MLPLVFAGEYSQVCPPELANYLAGALSWLYVAPKRDGRGQTVRRSIRAKLDHLADDLTARIAAIAAAKAAAYRDQKKHLLREFLFEETWSGWDKLENQKYVASAFVKTHSFLRVRDHNATFLVGRKGAGKSTLTHVLPMMLSPAPALKVRLDYEHMPFELAYNVLQQRPAAASDLRHTFSPIYSYQLVWDAFFHLCVAWLIVERLPRRSALRVRLNELLGPPLRRAVDPREREAIINRVLFVYAFEQVIAFLERTIAGSPASTLSTAAGMFSPAMLREFIFGRAGWHAFQGILEMHRKVGERVLITADGFDVMAHYFSLGSDDPRAAVQFETELLLALIQIVLNRGPARITSGSLYELADFCVALPYDRFLQVRELDRDRYQYRHKFTGITWSGIELSALVRKRLAVLAKVPDPKGDDLAERLSDVMRKGFAELPDELDFQFGAANHHMPLFLYILRHTFWRPRDVLFYYAILLAASEEFRRKRRTMPSGFVRQLVAGATRSIVEDEFLDEFRVSFRNLREVLWTFRGGPQVFGWREFNDRVGGMKFDVTLPHDFVATLHWKLELLFDLGAIGVVLDRETAKDLPAYRHAFSFNEGNVLASKLGRDAYEGLQYALHPVFCETLQLDTSANPELILPLDWSYLHENEVLIRNSRL